MQQHKREVIVPGDTVVHLSDWLSCALLGGFLCRFPTGPARAEAARCACLVGVVCLERWSAEGEATGMQWTLEDLLELAAGLVSGLDLSNLTTGSKPCEASSSCAAQARQALEVVSQSGVPSQSHIQEQRMCSWIEDVPVYVPESPRTTPRVSHPERHHPSPTMSAREPRLSSPPTRTRDVGSFAEVRSASAGSRSDEDCPRSKGGTPLRKGNQDSITKTASRGVRPIEGFRKVDSRRRLESPKVPVMEAAQMAHRSTASGNSRLVSRVGQSGLAAATPGGGAQGSSPHGRAAQARSGSADSRGRRLARPSSGATAPQHAASGRRVPEGCATSPCLGSTTASTPRRAIEPGGGGATTAAAHSSPSSGRRTIGGAPPPRFAGIVSPMPSGPLRSRHTLR